MKAFCTPRTEHMHCVGMKFLEFISLLNVPIQYLRVEELLLCSGDFCNRLFAPSLYCHNSEINLQVWFFWIVVSSVV